MATKKKIEWPTAVVLATTIAALAAVYVLVPDHRAEIAIGVGALGSIALAFLRGLVPPGVPALFLAIAIPLNASGCTPAQKAAFEGAMLSALEMAAKAAGRVLLDEAERALKFETSGGEE